MNQGKWEVDILNNKADVSQKDTESKNLCLHWDGSTSKDVFDCSSNVARMAVKHYESPNEMRSMKI